MNPTRTAVLACSLFAAASAAAQSRPDPITLQYASRPPFMVKDGDSLSGLAGKPAIDAFLNAGIPFFLSEVPTVRQLATIQANAGKICSVGWYETPSRLKFAKFTKALSRDLPMAGLANPRLRLPPNPSVDDALGQPGASVLTKNSLTYGDYLESKFASMKAARQTTDADYDHMVQMVRRGRADIVLLPYEEARYYATMPGYPPGSLLLVPFKDMPPGQPRRIMCSLSVDDSVISRLDQFIGKPNVAKPSAPDLPPTISRPPARPTGPS